MTLLRNWGLRLMCLALCLACLLGLVQPVAAVPQTAPTQFIYTALVRHGASSGSAVIGQMEDGTAVTVLDERGDFYKIDCYDSTGYIAKSQVRTGENGACWVDCDPASAETKTMPSVSLADALLLRSAIYAQSQLQLGVPYVYGGISSRGFDCSGLTSYVYKQNGYSLDRTASGQMQNGIIVAREGLQVGDLVFFREGWSRELATHVGIYVGDGEIIHAKRGGVRYSHLSGDWYTKCYIGARRVVNVSAIQTETAPVVTVDCAARYSGSMGMRTID